MGVYFSDVYIGVGEDFLKWILAIYKIPTSSIKVNVVLSSRFLINNGTRQGCLLLPILFLLTLEPFLNIVKANVDITEIKVGEKEVKVST